MVTVLNLESANADWDGRVELVASVKFFPVVFMDTAKNLWSANVTLVTQEFCVKYVNFKSDKKNVLLFT